MLLADAMSGDVARRVALAYAADPRVEAVALAGSTGAGRADADSDLDLYVYSDEPVPLAVREQVARGAQRLELDNRFFEPGDEWLDVSGVHIDAMFRSCAWIEQQLDRVMVWEEASVGYTTCFWYNVRHSRPLFDRQGWFGKLQASAARPYPEGLRRAVVAKNWPLLRDNLSSFRTGLARALLRRDAVSLNHRTTAWLASLFDILLALNRQLHPGEKQLLALVEASCPLRPDGLEGDVAALIRAAGEQDPRLLEVLDRLAGGLKALLLSEGLLPLAPQRP